MENVICIYMHLGTNNEIFWLVVTQVELERVTPIQLLYILCSKVIFLRKQEVREVKVQWTHYEIDGANLELEEVVT